MRITSMYLTMLFGLLISSGSRAQESKNIPSKLTDATVFFKGAELTHSANATLAKGENEIVVEGLSPNVDLNSIKIKASNGVIVSSYEFSIDFLSVGKPQAPRLKQLADSITYYQEKMEKVDIDLKINTTLLDQLQKGITKNVSGSEKGLGIDELMKTMDYYKSKSEQMETTQTALNKQKKQLNVSIARLKAQLNQESTKGQKTSGILKLSLASPRPQPSSFTITYYTAQASWVPYYDINILSTDKPIQIAQKSKVQQTTGLDWEKVKLTLSTATPSNGKTAPLFSSWFLKQREYAPAAPAPQAMMQNSYTYADEVVELAKEEEIQEQKIMIRGTGSVDQNREPLYIIDGRPGTAQEVQSFDPQTIKDITVLKDASATAIYGARGANGVIVITLKNSMDDYITESDNVLNMVYNIDLPYTIPGNGKVQSIDLQTKEATAEYKYYCAPKLDSETYLLAEIADWEKLGLLSGKANITYDGTYVGELSIDASSTQEKLTLTLGTDKRVAVKREKMKDFSSTKVLASDVEQVFTYTLTVKNNQNKPVKMVLKDQYPLSTQKKIEVNLLKDTTPWTANKEDLGVITWEEEFKAGETKTYKISYSVKYPKGMRLNL